MSANLKKKVERLVADAEFYIPNADEALWVRNLRISFRCSYREIGFRIRELWNGTWKSGDDQAMGIALCRTAAIRLGENHTKRPWVLRERK